MTGRPTLWHWCICTVGPGGDPGDALTSVADVGAVRGGGVVTWADYQAVEDRFVAAFRTVCAPAGVRELTVRGPELVKPVPPDFPEFNDGARVSVADAEHVVRAVLQERAFCSLSGPDRFCVTFGYDMYMYVRASEEIAPAKPKIEALGLYAHDLERPGDELFDGEPDGSVWTGSDPAAGQDGDGAPAEEG